MEEEEDDDDDGAGADGAVVSMGCEGVAPTSEEGCGTSGAEAPSLGSP